MLKEASILDYPKPSLNPKIWNEDQTLKPEVKEFILSFVDSFFAAQNFKSKDWIKDIQFVGSNTTDTYDTISDVDIHIVVDLPKFVGLEKPELSDKEASDFLDEVRKQVDQVKAKLPETENPIEIYFNTPHTSQVATEWSGIYSLTQNTWLEPPHIIGADFDISSLHPELLELAKETASELDVEFGEIKREIKDIKELETTIEVWDDKHKKLFQDKLEKKLTDLDEQVKELVDTREEIVESRKHYKALSKQEIIFKYLQRHWYMKILTDLKTLLKQSPEITEKDIPVVDNIMQQANLKEAASGAYWIDPTGHFYKIPTTHGNWIVDNVKILTSFGLPTNNLISVLQKVKSSNDPDDLWDKVAELSNELWDQMIDSGWIRIGDTPHGFALGIDVKNMRKIPDFIFDYASTQPSNYRITIEDDDGWMELTWGELAHGQKSVNKSLQQKRLQTAVLSKKEAGGVVDLNGVRVYKNPTQSQTAKLLEKSQSLELRALIDPLTKDIYVWDAFDLDHNRAIDWLGLDIDWSNEDEAGKYIWVVDNIEGIKYLYDGQSNLKKQAAYADMTNQERCDQVIMIDFDDTIAYENPDQTLGVPIEGVKEVLQKLKDQGYYIVIDSARANEEKGEDQIKEYMNKHDLPYDEIFRGMKPFAFRFIDDRAIQFTKWSEVLKQVEKAESEQINKECSLSQKFWIDPNGKEYSFSSTDSNLGGHYGWVWKNILKRDISELGGMKNQKLVEDATEELLQEGWIRITDSYESSGGQFGVEVWDLEHIPKTLDTFIAKHFNQAEAEKGIGIELDDHMGNFMNIKDPFPTIQQAVNKWMSHQMSVTPRAALSKKEATGFNPYGDPKFKEGPAYAVFEHIQPGFGPVPDMEMYTILGDHPMFGSTVQKAKILELGIPIKENPKKAQLHSEYDYSSTQFNLPKELSEKIIRWAVENIPEEDIVYDSKDPGTKGIQLESHITLKYGLLTDNFEEVQKALENEKAPHIKFEETSYFEPEGKDYDVVIIKVESEDLHNLNKKLCDAIKHEDTTGSEYHPHTTVAYVKRGEGKKYDGKDVITGEEVGLNALTFSPKNGEPRILELGNKKESSFMPSNTDLAPSDDWAGTKGYPTNEAMDAPWTTDYQQEYFMPQEDRPRSINWWKKILNLFKPISKKEVKKDNVGKEAAIGNVWVDPKGKLYSTEGSTHAEWIQDNLEMLEKNYHLYVSKRVYNQRLKYYKLVEQGEDNVDVADVWDIWEEMIDQGWVRVGDAGGDIEVGVEVKDLRNIPSFLDSVLAQRTRDGMRVEIEQYSDKNSVTLTYPFKSVQQEVNKALQQKRLTTAKQWTAPKEPVNQPGMDWQWADYIYNYVEKNWQDFLVGWLELDPKNYVKPVVLIEKIYEDEGRVSAWVHIEFVNKAAQSDAFIKMIISADIHYEPSYEPEGVETHEWLDNWETEILDYGVADSLEKDSSYGPTNYKGPSVADHGYQNSAWDDMNVTYSPKEDEELMDQNGADGYPNRWMSRHRGPYYTNEGKVVKMLEDTKPQKQAVYRGNMDIWLAPNGQEFSIHRSHANWIVDETNLLNEDYDLVVPAEGTLEGNDLVSWLISKGWVRATGILPNELDLTVFDINKLPQQVEQFVWKYKPEVVIVEDLNGQDISFDKDEYSKGLIQHATLKIKADISGKAVNDILHLIQTTGGATYDILNSRSLAGTSGYAVAIYPTHEQITNQVDFEVLEKYIVDNEDLLLNSKNALGAWVSNGKTYLDIINIIQDKEEAMIVARQYKQLAIFDLARMQELSVSNFINSNLKCPNCLSLNVEKCNG